HRARSGGQSGAARAGGADRRGVAAQRRPARLPRARRRGAWVQAPRIARPPASSFTVVLRADLRLRACGRHRAGRGRGALVAIAHLTRNAVAVLPEGALEEKLKLGRPLRVKLGIDVTAPDVTLGNGIPLQRMRA